MSMYLRYMLNDMFCFQPDRPQQHDQSASHSISAERLAVDGFDQGISTRNATQRILLLVVGRDSSNLYGVVV